MQHHCNSFRENQELMMEDLLSHHCAFVTIMIAFKLLYYFSDLLWFFISNAILFLSNVASKKNSSTIRLRLAGRKIHFTDYILREKKVCKKHNANWKIRDFFHFFYLICIWNFTIRITKKRQILLEMWMIFTFCQSSTKLAWRFKNKKGWKFLLVHRFKDTNPCFCYSM